MYKVCSVMGWMRPPYAYSLRWGLWLPAVDGCFAVDDCCELTPRAAIIEAYATTRGTKKSGRLFSLAKILGGNSLNCCHEKRVKQRILDAFEYEIEQEWINKLVLSIQQRLKDCLSRDVAFTGW